MYFYTCICIYMYYIYIYIYVYTYKYIYIYIYVCIYALIKHSVFPVPPLPRTPLKHPLSTPPLPVWACNSVGNSDIVGNSDVW